MVAQSFDDGAWSWLMPQCNNVNGDWAFLVLVGDCDLAKIFEIKEDWIQIEANNYYLKGSKKLK